jgi:hypothetical protein
VIPGTDMDALPRGLCSYCDALVYPGGNCFFSTSSTYMHMRCYMLICDKERKKKEKEQLEQFKADAKRVAVVIICIALLVYGVYL